MFRSIASSYDRSGRVLNAIIGNSTGVQFRSNQGLGSIGLMHRSNNIEECIHVVDSSNTHIVAVINATSDLGNISKTVRKYHNDFDCLMIVSSGERYVNQFGQMKIYKPVSKTP